MCNGTFTDFPAEDFDLAVIASNGLGNGRAFPSMRGEMDYIDMTLSDCDPCFYSSIVQHQ